MGSLHGSFPLTLQIGLNIISSKRPGCPISKFHLCPLEHTTDCHQSVMGLCIYCLSPTWKASLTASGIPWGIPLLAGTWPLPRSEPGAGEIPVLFRLLVYPFNTVYQTSLGTSAQITPYLIHLNKFSASWGQGLYVMDSYLKGLACSPHVIDFQ